MHGHSVVNALGIGADALAVLLICAGVSLYWYLRHGHPVPGHYRHRIEPEPEPEPGPLEGSGEIREHHSGVWSGPSVAPVEDDHAATLAMGDGAFIEEGEHV